MKCWLTIGRFQPLHDGHIALIRSKLDEGKKVCVMIRDTKRSSKNPYGMARRMSMFMDKFKKEIEKETLILKKCPDIEGVFYGRDVGYEVEQVRLDAQTEEISATKIRAGERKEVDPDVYEKPVEDVIAKYSNIKLKPNNTAT